MNEFPTQIFRMKLASWHFSVWPVWRLEKLVERFRHGRNSLGNFQRKAHKKEVFNVTIQTQWDKGETEREEEEENKTDYVRPEATILKVGFRFFYFSSFSSSVFFSFQIIVFVACSCCFHRRVAVVVVSPDHHASAFSVETPLEIMNCVFFLRSMEHFVAASHHHGFSFGRRYFCHCSCQTPADRKSRQWTKITYSGHYPMKLFYRGEIHFGIKTRKTMVMEAIEWNFILDSLPHHGRCPTMRLPTISQHSVHQLHLEMFYSKIGCHRLSSLRLTSIWGHIYYHY